MNLSVSLSLDKAELSLLPLIGKPSDEEMKPCGMPKPPLGKEGGIAQR